MQPRISLLLFALFCIPRVEAADNPNYSNAIYRHDSPEAFLAGFESQLNSKSGRIVSLPYAAKAALEAGQFEKAKAYAIETIQVADSRVRDRYSKQPKPRSEPGIGTSDFFGNFVLGRLAMRDGDIRVAGAYLIAAGKTTGDPALDTFGPNMSLAYELLRTGDARSTQDVLLFLQECRLFWRSELIDPWIVGIQQKRMPDFGVQLYL